MKIDITGTPGVGTNETSDLIKNIQTTLLDPTVLFAMITFIFILAVETLWGSYFKTQDSVEFAKDSPKIIRAMIFFSWLSGTILAFGVSMYLAGPILFGDVFGPPDRMIIVYVTGSLIFAYFINSIVTGLGGAPTYTILGNFLSIK